jgi:uncharacterized protein with HEPN domain
LKSHIEYLRHILDEITFLLDKSQTLNKEDFLSDEVLKRAFVRSLEIIGEAARKLPIDFRQRYSQTDWRAIAGTRDKLIHDYLGVDYDIVWDIVTNKVHALKIEIENIIAEENQLEMSS